ncbi:hypothetical protein AZH53_10155 [Methanomicrobiaceae archaeon CYW5]|uniref:hypothetical protein n=1 Tax=Methanovulcanius yangii TaxID=1789227 RepID=UPI0029C9FDD4|nr:hypothetical protein [Methanovulcanius yangii]MBT8508767.1 hypothetical protein [Methanovulcanius yangii]
MARTLSARDITILKKLAPEWEGADCSESGTAYRSILPPVANHYATDAADFRRRCERLTAEELADLLALIDAGEESLCCLRQDYFTELYGMTAAVLGDDAAAALLTAYRTADDCFI